MKKLTKTGVSLMVLSAFLFAPVASHAQLNTNLTGEVTAELDSAIDANVEANTNVDTSVGTDATIDSNTNVGIDVDSGSGSQADEDKDSGGNIKSDSNTSLNLRVNSSGVAVTSSSQVNSEADLDVFSANVSAKDKQVAKVTIDSGNTGESEVKVVYRHKGKFLGFIPVTIKSTTVVKAKANAEAEVRSKLSWWGFLVAKKNYAKADLESRIKNNATIKANAKVNASAQAKAQVAEAVIAEVAAHANNGIESDQNQKDIAIQEEGVKKSASN